jgi:hypothetical protein
VNDSYEAAASDGGYESSAAADRYSGYYETEAETQARIAALDELSAAREPDATAGDDNPDSDDEAEAELGTEYDADASAFLAWQDELPTPQESRTARWGDNPGNPDYDDEPDLAAGDDGGVSAFLAAGDQLYEPGPSQETEPATGDGAAPSQAAEAADPSAATAPDRVDANAAAPEPSPAGARADAASTADAGDQPAEAPQSDQADARAEQSPEAPTWLVAYVVGIKAEVDTKLDAMQTKVDAAETKADDARAEAQSAQEALTSAEAAHQAETGTLRQEFSDAREDWASERASDHVLMDKLSDALQQSRAKVEALEQELARMADRPPGTEITGKNLSSGERADAKEAEGHLGRWRLPSDARINLGAAVAGGALSEAADYLADGAAHHVFGIAGVALSVGVGVIGVIRENRKSKNAHRPED